MTTTPPKVPKHRANKARYCLKRGVVRKQDAIAFTSVPEATISRTDFLTLTRQMLENYGRDDTREILMRLFS
jgi:hypothetical protein